MDLNDAIVHVGSVPEPGSMALLAIGGAGSLFYARKRRKAAAVVTA